MELMNIDLRRIWFWRPEYRRCRRKSLRTMLTCLIISIFFTFCVLANEQHVATATFGYSEAYGANFYQGEFHDDFIKSVDGWSLDLPLYSVPDSKFFLAAQDNSPMLAQKSVLCVDFSAEVAKRDRFRINISQERILFGNSILNNRRSLPFRTTAVVPRFYQTDIDQPKSSRDTTQAGRTDSIYTYKSPTTTFIIGFIPGFFIHGLAHDYIGKKNTALALFGIELLSIGLFVRAFILAQRMEEGSSHDSGDPEPWGLASFALFISSWMYDFAAAPVKARKMNEQAERERTSKAGIFIGGGIKDNQARLVISLRW